jgi:hypothetical protein
MLMFQYEMSFVNETYSTWQRKCCELFVNYYFCVFLANDAKLLIDYCSQTCEAYSEVIIIALYINLYKKL